MDDMKKTLVVSLGAMLLLSSCGTYTGTGAYVGGSFGSIIGSAVGGIAGGWRGSDIGTLIGMAGGAAVGAAVGAAADKAEQQRYEEYVERRQHRYDDYGRTRSSERRMPQYGQNDGRGAYGNDRSGFDSSNSIKHGCFIDNLEIRYEAVPHPSNRLRVLLYNIQDGMWADQDKDFVNFVAFVRKYDPDVCIFCEAQSCQLYVSFEGRSYQP